MDKESKRRYEFSFNGQIRCNGAAITKCDQKFETTASGPKEALRNMTHQAKMRLGYVKSANITLHGVISWTDSDGIYYERSTGRI